MRFLFRLDLSLHAGAGKKIWNLDFGNQTRPRSFQVQVQVQDGQNDYGRQRGREVAGHVHPWNMQLFSGPQHASVTDRSIDPAA